MCGRYYRRSDKQRIAEAFHLGTLDDIPLEAAPSYNIAPSTMQPVIRNNRDTGEREMVAMRWGMVPNFAKSLADFKGFSTINAKAETLLSKPLWRVPFHRRRCLIPADGFYEWKRLDAKTKQPYAFALRSGYALTLAPVVWVLIAEIFPNRVRSQGVSAAVSALWMASFALTYTFPLLE